MQRGVSVPKIKSDKMKIDKQELKSQFARSFVDMSNNVD